MNYETNNFLGLGETLSAVANIGDLSRNLTFGFNEPYLRNKPISVGIEAFDRKTDYNPAKAYAIANNTAANLSNAQSSLLTNYNQSTKGFTISANEPLKHLWSSHGGHDPYRRHLWAAAGVHYNVQRTIRGTCSSRWPPFRGCRAEPVEWHRLHRPSSPASRSRAQVAAFPAVVARLRCPVQIAGAGGNVKYVQPVASITAVLPDEGPED